MDLRPCDLLGGTSFLLRKNAQWGIGHDAPQF